MLAAVWCLLLPGTSWAVPVLVLPCQRSSQLRFGLSCHHQFVERGFATSGYPWRGLAKGSQGKTIPLWLGLNALSSCHLQLPWKGLSSSPDEKVKPWGASGQQTVPGRQSQVWHQCPCVSLHSALPYTSGTWEFSHSEWPSSWPASMVLQPRRTSRMWPGVGFLSEMGLQISHLKQGFNHKLPCCTLKKKK